MKINHIGGNPSEQYTVVDNRIVRASELSLRARGLMVLLLSHNTGFDITAEGISKQAAEGRDAVRNAFTELEMAGYIMREKFRISGQWHQRIDVYRDGSGPGKPTSANQHGNPSAPENPTSANQRRKTSAGGSGAIKKDQEEAPIRSALTSPDDVGGDQDGKATAESETEPHQQQQPVSHGATDRVTPPFPRWAIAKLGRAGEAQAQAWQQAWATITSMVDPHWDPNLHLTKYLAQCEELRRTPTPSDWTKWYAEDETRAAQDRAKAAAADRSSKNPYWE